MAEGIKKVKARDEFASFAEDLLEIKFGKLNSVQQSHALAQFYIKEIHNKLRSEIPDEDLQFALVDASNDLGCDILHRDDGHVLILQAKISERRDAGITRDHFTFSVYRKTADRSCN